MNDKKRKYKPLVPAVEQAAEVLLCLAKSGESMNLTSICKEVGIHKSKGYGILNTLMKFGFVKRDNQTKRYSLGPVHIYLASKVLEQMDYKVISEPFLKDLARETKCASFFGLVVDDYIYVIAKQDSDIGVKLTIPLGYRFPLTYGAHGKALFSSLNEEKRKEILNSKELHFHGYKKKPDLKRLAEEVKFYQKNGFSLDLGEIDPRFKAIASSVKDFKDEPIGVVFIVGVFEEKKAYQLGVKVKECAKKISYALGAERRGL